MIKPDLMNFFTPLEVLLFSALVTLVGGIVALARYFYLYMRETNKERAEEIRSATKVQTELEKAIEKHNYLVEQLPARLHDQVRAAIKD